MFFLSQTPATMVINLPSWFLVSSPIHMQVRPDDLPGPIHFYSIRTWLQLQLDWIISPFYFTYMPFKCELFNQLIWNQKNTANNYTALAIFSTASIQIPLCTDRENSFFFALKYKKKTDGVRENISIIIKVTLLPSLAYIHSPQYTRINLWVNVL